MKRIITISAVLTLLVLTGCDREPIANFAYTPANPNTGQLVIFENLSLDAASYEWDFGDGNSSNAYSPSHSYMSGGTFTVRLKAFGRRGGISEATAVINVISVQPSAEFEIYTDLPGDEGPVVFETDIVFVGEQVEFFNTTNNGIAYLWEFGDGYTTELASPVYSYDEPGTYTVTLNAFGQGGASDQVSKTLYVVEGINSVLRITVLEYWDGYPVEGASVLLFGSVSDWETETDPSEEVFTTSLGKCVFEGLNDQVYYVDVWEENHDNYTLAADDIGFIETQILEPGYIHDFIAYVDYYEPEKKMALTRIGKKELARKNVSVKKSSEFRKIKENKFSSER